MNFLLVSLLCFCLTTQPAQADRATLQTAYVQVVIYQNSGSDYTTFAYDLKGAFVKSGATTSAEGDILQIHPLGLCNTSGDDNLYEYGWVGVVKLTEPEENNPPCMGIFDKAKRAIQRGATALIFDVTDDPEAAAQLNSVETTVDRPVVVIEGEDAEKLMNIVKRQKVARARINYQIVAPEVEEKRGSNEYFDMVIFMTFFVLVSIICFILLLKIKWRQKQKETSLTRMALHAVSRMEARKYISSKQAFSSSQDDDDEEIDEQSMDDDTSSCCSSKHRHICVICLESFKEGQDIRIVPCRHEFHRECVDPWLLTNHTCPLCMLNIVESEHNRKKPRRSRNIFPYILNRLCMTARNRQRQQVLQDSQRDGMVSHIPVPSQNGDSETVSGRDVSVNSLTSQLGSSDHLDAFRRNDSLAQSLEIINTESFIRIEDSLCYSYSKSNSSDTHRTTDSQSCESCNGTTQSDSEVRWNFHKQPKRYVSNTLPRTYINPVEGKCMCRLFVNASRSACVPETLVQYRCSRDSQQDLSASQNLQKTSQDSIPPAESSLSLCSNQSQTDSIMRCESLDCVSMARSESDVRDYTHSIVVIAQLPEDHMAVKNEDVV